ncbi:hypothetical protein [Mycobacterium leprae]|uniref:hypothetical protein n=1 Tax=Mycobacterium leprae TaxID=1769 RepID=UPI0002FBE67E|nr:hypothetical protein [Mycobacterium leprae]
MKLAKVHAAVVVPRLPTVRQRVRRSGPRVSGLTGSLGLLTAKTVVCSVSVSMFTSSNCRVFNGDISVIALPVMAPYLVGIAASQHR